MLASFIEVLTTNAQRYPLWQAQDVYKLAHQASMGSEHAFVNPAHASAWLKQELEFLIPAEISEPLIDPINERGTIVRVHLRPFSRLNLTPDLLLEASIRTAAEYYGSTALLENYAAQALTLPDHLPGINTEELDDLFAGMKEKGYPPMHHSEVYSREYAPAYRVAARAFLPPAWLEL